MELIKYFKEFKEEQSDVITTLLSIELEDMTFLSENDVDEYMEEIEDNYNDVLTQTDYLYILDLACMKLDEAYEGDIDE